MTSEEAKVARREDFWHNYRVMRQNMRGASPEQWAQMKIIAKVGMLGFALYRAITTFDEARAA